MSVPRPTGPGTAGGAGGPVTLGVDVGGTKMLGLALDADGAVLARCGRPSPPPGPPAAASAMVSAGAEDDAPGTLVAALADMAGEMCSAVESAGHRAPSALGIGLPGLVDDDGRLRVAPNLPAGDDRPVAALLAGRTGLRVVADNDATCAAVAEWSRGAAAGYRHALVVTLGTGIGGGLVCDGRIMRGARGFAGEVGHMVVDPAGPPCPCGKRGCWERFASGSALARLAREASRAGRLSSVMPVAGDDPDAVRGEHVAAAAADGDPDAQRVLDELGFWIGVGLSNLAVALDPEVIVLGGGLFPILTQVLDAVRGAFFETLEGAERRPHIPILPAVFGEEAGATGAAMVARHHDRHAGCGGRARRA